MVMKAAIAIALSHHADFLIMDEPTSGLDPVFRRELLDLLFQILQNEKKSILFSTHITSDLERIADYITLVIKGRIIFSTTKDEVFEKYALVKGGMDFLTSDSKKYLSGIRQGEYGFEALTANATALKKLAASDVILEKASLEDIMYFVNLESNHV